MNPHFWDKEVISEFECEAETICYCNYETFSKHFQNFFRTFSHSHHLDQVTPIHWRLEPESLANGYLTCSLKFSVSLRANQGLEIWYGESFIKVKPKMNFPSIFYSFFISSPNLADSKSVLTQLSHLGKIPWYYKCSILHNKCSIYSIPFGV